MSTIKCVLWVFIVVSVLGSLVLVVFFIYQFHSYGLSTNISDWAYFGSYINPIVGILNTILLAGISFLLYKLERNWETSKQIENHKKEIFKLRNELFFELKNQTGDLTKTIFEEIDEGLNFSSETISVNYGYAQKIRIHVIKLSQFLGAHTIEFQHLGLLNKSKDLLLAIRSFSNFVTQYSEKEKIEYNEENYEKFMNELHKKAENFLDLSFNLESDFREIMIKERYMNRALFKKNENDSKI